MNEVITSLKYSLKRTINASIPAISRSPTTSLVAHPQRGESGELFLMGSGSIGAGDWIGLVVSVTI
jgi:hypothetical protein